MALVLQSLPQLSGEMRLECESAVIAVDCYSYLPSKVDCNRLGGWRWLFQIFLSSGLARVSYSHLFEEVEMSSALRNLDVEFVDMS